MTTMNYLSKALLSSRSGRNILPRMTPTKKVDRTKKYECTLNSALVEKARTELNEDPSRRADDIEALRKWILKQRHINGRTDDAFLLRFLRNCKFSIERSKKKMDMFYTMKTALPEWFSGTDVRDPLITKIIKSGVIVPMGYVSEGRRIGISQVGNLHPSICKVDILMKFNHLVAEYVLMDEQTQICGTDFLIDMAGVSPALVSQFTPTVINKIMTLYQDAFPVRMKSLHFLNTPAVFDLMFPMIKSFIKSKLLQRVHLHGSNLASLHAHISPRYLPTEYGGTAGNIRTFIDVLEKDLLELREYFIEEEHYKVDESKRPGKPKTALDLFGVDGTFRKLTID